MQLRQRDLEVTCMEERMGGDTGFYLKGRLYLYQKSAVFTGPSLIDVFCLSFKETKRTFMIHKRSLTES